jgi:hypothetical protein
MRAPLFKLLIELHLAAPIAGLSRYVVFFVKLTVKATCRRLSYIKYYISRLIFWQENAHFCLFLSLRHVIVYFGV